MSNDKSCTDLCHREDRKWTPYGNGARRNVWMKMLAHVFMPKGPTVLICLVACAYTFQYIVCALDRACILSLYLLIPLWPFLRHIIFKILLHQVSTWRVPASSIFFSILLASSKLCPPVLLITSSMNASRTLSGMFLALPDM